MPQYRIRKTIFTYISIIRVKIYSNHPKNMNHVHKYTNDLVSVIITLGTNKSGLDNMFYEGVKMTDLVNIDIIPKHYLAELFFVHLRDVLMNIIFGEDTDQ